MLKQPINMNGKLFSFLKKYANEEKSVNGDYKTVSFKISDELSFFSHKRLDDKTGEYKNVKVTQIVVDKNNPLYITIVNGLKTLLPNLIDSQITDILSSELIIKEYPEAQNPGFSIKKKQGEYITDNEYEIIVDEADYIGDESYFDEDKNEDISYKVFEIHDEDDDMIDQLEIIIKNNKYFINYRL